MTRLLIPTIAMMVLVSCASTSYREELEGFKQGFEMMWGPEKNWTDKQRAKFIVELQRYHERRMAEERSRPTPIIGQPYPIYQPLPEYQPRRTYHATTDYTGGWYIH